ncbi:MAG: hypothetical protein IJ105_00060 [Bacilli bacterium]|nr:hypothetical protein [Bacilli bacterium]
MGILDKVRDFFYDDEYEEENEKNLSKHKEKPKKEKIKIVEKTEDLEEKQEISERELFKAERTFNFPFDVDDEEPEEKKEEVKPVEKEPVYKSYDNEYKQTKPLSIRNYTKYEKEEEKESEKKFKPTPVISPIYGILDKNYKKEDLLIDNTKEPEEKKLDYETVRKRAYSKVYDTGEEESKSIFFNLDEEKKDEEDEVKIIYNDVETEEETQDDNNKTIGEKIEEYENSLKEENNESEDENILSETKEQDLFNLIDNMYNSDEDEEEVEE